MPSARCKRRSCGIVETRAATITFVARQYTLTQGVTIYVPDGVEGYFPYTIVASASS
jgi:hypothetical protein